MRVALYSENMWLYPDLEPCGPRLEHVYLARGGHAGVQVALDGPGGPLSARLDLPDGVSVRWYRMRPVRVERNSAPKIHTTLDHDLVKDFVTRQAPFEVYDLMEPVADPADMALEPGRAVLFLRLCADAGMAPVNFDAAMRLRAGGETAALDIPVTVTAARVPPPAESGFSVNNWLNYDEMARVHGARPGTARWDSVFDAYLDHLLELRSTELKLPSGEPVRGADGRVVDFDFSLCEAVAKRALGRGFEYVLGGFVARFTVWDEPEHYLLWDRGVGVCSIEGYRQLALYFRKLWAMVTRNGWQAHWMQCLVDEPQFPNSMSYRALSAICRKCMPGVVINDPVETTDIPGATDIWCVKQAVFDAHRDTFKQLQALGERLTVYTCGYPAGRWMNRCTDLPLTAGRLVFWLCALEGLEGFLHWGYNSYAGLDPLAHNCYPVGEDDAMPPGNGFIVYPGADGPLDTLRSQIQLLGAEDAALLRQLPPDRVAELVGPLCTGFHDYDPDPARFDEARRELLCSFG